MAVTIFLADDHQIVRQGLRAILRTEPDFSLVGEAAEGLETLRAVERLRPDVLVLDLMMPGLSGIEVARQVARRSPRTRVVVLSMHCHESYVREAMQAGAAGYVPKESGVEELVRAIREVMAGKQCFGRLLSKLAAPGPSRRTDVKPADSYETLTAREREVLELTAEGQTGGEISERLYISPRTVESHRANLMRKLGVRNQKELIRYAVERRVPSEGPQVRPGRTGSGPLRGKNP